LFYDPAPGLPSVHPTEHFIGGKDLAAEQAVRFAPAHRLEQLVLGPPGGGIGDAEVAFEREGGEVVLVLGDQIARLKRLG